MSIVIFAAAAKVAREGDYLPGQRVHLGPPSGEAQEAGDGGAVDVGVEDGGAEARAREGDGEVD